MRASLKSILVGGAFAALGACESLSGLSNEVRPVTDPSVPILLASVETTPVASGGDAADDPAIIVPTDGSAPIILGTDKKAGLYVYNLGGEVLQFLPTGRLNNVDATPIGDRIFAAASNRSDNTVVVFDVAGSTVSERGRFDTVRSEPYGLCTGRTDNGDLIVIVTHKNGAVDVYRAGTGGSLGGELQQTVALGEQLEGCVIDQENGAAFVGREESGITRFDYDTATGMLGAAASVDEIGDASGIVGDVEGLTLYTTGERTGYLIASSQGNNTFAVYDRVSGGFLTRFSIGSGQTIDGAEETDGIAATSATLPGFPQGVLVVQDGFNDPGEKQNFKIVDWREIEALIPVIVCGN